MRAMFRVLLWCGLAVLAVTPAGAAEKLRVVKAVAFAWTFTPLDVGIADRHLRQARPRRRSLRRRRRRQAAAGA